MYNVSSKLYQSSPTATRGGGELIVTEKEDTMRRYFVLFALTFAVATFTSATVFAQMGMMGGDKGHGFEKRHGEMSGKMGMSRGGPFSVERMREVLNLSEEQEQQMRKLRMDYKKENIRKHADLKVARLELSELMQEKNMNMGKVEKKVRQVEGIQGNLMLFRINNLMKAKEFLSDEQFDKFRKMTRGFSSHRKRHGMMKKGMHGKGMMKKGMRGGMYMEEEYDSP